MDLTEIVCSAAHSFQWLMKWYNCHHQKWIYRVSWQQKWSSWTGELRAPEKGRSIHTQ